MMKEKTDAQLKAALRNAGHRVGNMRRETMLARIAAIESAQAAAVRVLEEAAVDDFETAMSSLKARFPDRFTPEVAVPPQNRIQNILGQVDAPPPAKPIAIGGCSEAQVMEAIKDNVAKGMTAMFHDNCWTFRHGKREDSGTMAQPVGNIVKCADAVMQQAVSADRLGLTKSLLF